MFALRRRSQIESDFIEPDAGIVDASAGPLTMREGLLLDEKEARRNATPIPYLGKEPRLATDFVIAPPPARFPMRISALKGAYTCSSRHRLRRIARAISSAQVTHTIMDDEKRPEVCIHRVVINP